MEEDFIPDQVQTQRSNDGQLVRFVFEKDSGDRKTVTFDGYQLLSVLQLVQKEIAQHPSQRNSVTPISKESLQIGALFKLVGWGVGEQKGGGAVLTLHVDLHDVGRVVTMPIRLSQSEALEIVNTIKAAAKIE
jgi:hypothetical protein